MANYKIDKSVFDENELSVWNQLVAKGMVKVDPAANQEEMEDQEPGVPAEKKPAEKAEVETMEETKKSAPVEPEVPQFVKDAIAKSEAFIEEQNKREMAQIAKKYAVLVEDTDALATQLYDLKKSSPEVYDTCIAMMDQQAALIEKSGVYVEIGKSGHGGSYNGLSGAEAKAEAKAQELMKADPNMTHEAAIAKAWEDPKLAAEYDAEYFGK